MPPTSIDGTDITGATIDGQEVEEITVDGDTVFTAGPDIPDSGDLHAHHDATVLSLSDGDLVSTWGDESGNGNDLTEGTAPTYTADGINSNPVVTFDGVDDYLESSFPTQSQPNTIFFAIDITDTGDISILFDGEDDGGINPDEQGVAWDYEKDRYYINPANEFGSGGSPGQGQKIVTVILGSTSRIRVNGTEVLSTNVGFDFDGLTLAASRTGGNPADVMIGEVAMYPYERSGSGVTSVETYLSDKWGISI